ncbi:MAG: hypothetical protein ACYCTV_01790 [Leptospirales bacterium]
MRDIFSNDRLLVHFFQINKECDPRVRMKEGNPLRSWSLLSRLDGRMQKVQKENDKEIQDLIMLLARRAGVL